MKVLALLTGMLSLGAMGTALAADLPVKARPAPPPVPIYNWTGFYAGVNVGGDVVTSHGDGRVDPLFPSTPSAIANLNRQFSPRFQNTVVLGGVQAGYNWQAGAWLVGVEADIDARRARGTITVDPLVFDIPTPGNFSTQTFESNWLATFRGRLGGVVGNSLLLYVTGGLAVSDYRTSDAVHFGGPNVTQTATISETRLGWAAGAGAEWMFAPNWSVKLEYIHADLGRTDSGIPPFPGFPTSGINFSHRLTDDLGRVGLNYHFGGPVVAKY